MTGPIAAGFGLTPVPQCGDLGGQTRIGTADAETVGRVEGNKRDIIREYTEVERRRTVWWHRPARGEWYPGGDSSVVRFRWVIRPCCRSHLIKSRMTARILHGKMVRRNETYVRATWVVRTVYRPLLERVRQCWVAQVSGAAGCPTARSSRPAL